MKELQENAIDQIRTLIRYLTETDLLNNKEVFRCLDVIEREWRRSGKKKLNAKSRSKNNLARGCL